MAKTLLEIVQKVLSETGYDEVDSISDTVDSQQVAMIVESVFEEIRELNDLPSGLTYFQLNATGTSTPTVMSIPDGVHEIVELEYNVKEDSGDPDNFQPIRQVDLVTFYRASNQLDETGTDVDTVSIAGATSYKIRNDVAPSMFTVYNDKYILFNAYNSALETNLQKVKSRCLGYKYATFQMTDSFDIPLSPQLLLLLEEKSKARVNSSLRQTDSPELSRTVRRLEVRASSTKDRTGKKQIKVPHYERVT